MVLDRANESLMTRACIRFSAALRAPVSRSAYYFNTWRIVHELNQEIKSAVAIRENGITSDICVRIMHNDGSDT